jgi:hypothetical protein
LAPTFVLALKDVADIWGLYSSSRFERLLAIELGFLGFSLEEGF